MTGSSFGLPGQQLPLSVRPPQKIFLTLDLRNVDFYCIFCSSRTYFTSKKHCFWAYKTCCCSLHAMHSTETAKGGKQSLLESRNLLQTTTLVFPQPIVYSRLSNNINILAKKISGRQRGGGAMAPRPWIRTAGQ